MTKEVKELSAGRKFRRNNVRLLYGVRSNDPIGVTLRLFWRNRGKQTFLVSSYGSVFIR